MAIDQFAPHFLVAAPMRAVTPIIIYERDTDEECRNWHRDWDGNKNIPDNL